MQLFSADATMFLKENLTFFCQCENMNKLASKVAHNRPQFYLVLPTGPKSAQISYPVP